MTGETEKSIKVTVLLEYYQGEKDWTASVPLINGCLADGPTPETATMAVQKEIDLFIQNDPNILETLRSQPEFRITEIEIKNG